jgi:hypothetical protein
MHIWSLLLSSSSLSIPSFPPPPSDWASSTLMSYHHHHNHLHHHHHHHHFRSRIHKLVRKCHIWTSEPGLSRVTWWSPVPSIFLQMTCLVSLWLWD